MGESNATPEKKLIIEQSIPLPNRLFWLSLGCPACDGKHQTGGGKCNHWAPDVCPPIAYLRKSALGRSSLFTIKVASHKNRERVASTEQTKMSHLLLLRRPRLSSLFFVAESSVAPLTEAPLRTNWEANSFSGRTRRGVASSGSARYHVDIPATPINRGAHMRSSSDLTGRRSDPPFWRLRSHDAAGFLHARGRRLCNRGSPGLHAALVCHGEYSLGPGGSREHRC